MTKNILITGGSRGIGRACVELFARKGWRVAFLCRTRKDAAKPLADKLRAEGHDVEYFLCDVSDRARVNEVIGELLHRWHRIDALVNNAAIAQIALFTDLAPEDWRRIFAVNVDGVFNCTQAVLGGMISEKSGAIVNISSMWGQVGASCEVAYSAAKAAVIGLTKALAKEVGPSGVRVNCVCPGVIDTDMNAALDEATRAALTDETPLERIGTPEDVARAVAYLCSEDASFVTGQILGVNGGMVI